MELLVKPESLTSCIYTIYIYIDLRLATLKAVSFYLLAQCFNIESMQKVFLCHIYV
jgi:hypothetical protein